MLQFCVQLCEVPFQETTAAAAVNAPSPATQATPVPGRSALASCALNQVRAAVRGAHAVLVVYDAASSRTFSDVDVCLDVVCKHWSRGLGALALVACKSDLRHTGDAAHVTDEELRGYCSAAGFHHHWQCSHHRGARCARLTTSCAAFQSHHARNSLC